jgi:F420-dependent methylenetetrahydromethanopterin dehydrogenase
MERAAKEFLDVVEMCRPYLADWIKTLGEAGAGGNASAAATGIDVFLKAQASTKASELDRVVKEIRSLRQESLEEEQTDAGGHAADSGPTGGDRPIEPDPEPEA